MDYARIRQRREFSSVSSGSKAANTMRLPLTRELARCVPPWGPPDPLLQRKKGTLKYPETA